MSSISLPWLSSQHLFQLILLFLFSVFLNGVFIGIVCMCCIARCGGFMQALWSYCCGHNSRGGYSSSGHSSGNTLSRTMLGSGTAKTKGSSSGGNDGNGIAFNGSSRSSYAYSSAPTVDLHANDDNDDVDNTGNGGDIEMSNLL